MEWHEGEYQMHKLLGAPHGMNPTSPGLSPHSQRLLHRSSLFAIGIVDDEERPWTTVLAGEPSFARSLGHSIVGVEALADVKFDPVVAALLRKRSNTDADEDVERRRDFSALGVHLASRDRVKLQGEVVGAGKAIRDHPDEFAHAACAEFQMALAITGSLGNCPKYLNKKNIILTPPKPLMLSDALPLSEAALSLLARADIFFITSCHPSHMSTNDRGGSPGFVRVEKNDASGTILVYPEYSGNRLYQTLGNLFLDPRAGVVVPDFETGNVLHLTCTTKILFGEQASATLPRSNLAVQLLVQSAILVERGLGFRGVPGEPSPYNPPVRYLPRERPTTDIQSQTHNEAAFAKLLDRKILTPTIARFKFSISDPKAAGQWSPGQYVALAFETELSDGYAHMNEDDPRSLNDDYVRTFTVSSPPYASGCGGELQQDQFEITARNVGKVTNFLFKFNLRAGLEVPLRGFAGDFTIHQNANDRHVVPFIAGGIGVTPLLAQLRQLDLARLKLFWTINIDDLGLVTDTFHRCPDLGSMAMVYVSGVKDGFDHPGVKEAADAGAKVLTRRINESDIMLNRDMSDTWYLCTGPALRQSLVRWLHGKTTIYEDFDY